MYCSNICLTIPKPHPTPKKMTDSFTKSKNLDLTVRSSNGCIHLDLLLQEHSYLVHKLAVGEWTVNRCLNCGVETHATSQLSSVVLLSPQLQVCGALNCSCVLLLPFVGLFFVVYINAQETWSNVQFLKFYCMVYVHLSSV